MSTVQIDNPPELDPRFVQALLGEDELGVVVRSHIFVEANINQYTELVVSIPEHLRGLRLGYRQRILLACALGFDPEFKDALLSLGEIRNSFSHKLDTKLTAELVNSLFTKLPSKGRQAVEYSYERIKTQLDSEGKLPLGELPPRDRFILIALNLERLVMAAILMVKAAQKNAI